MTTVPYPPETMDFVGGSFKATGDEFERLFVRLGGLRPNHRVLDIGCGIGRMAIPLTRVLGHQGSYEGFDVVEFGIKWCHENITPLYPNFRFQQADVYNHCYNPQGRYRGDEWVFPYKDAEFDFVFLTSIFTHMPPPEVEHYLQEITRVLKPGGVLFCTYFLHNPEVVKVLERGNKASALTFKHKREDYYIDNPEIPEQAVCHSEERIRATYEKYRLRVDAIHCGTWVERANGLSGQDIVIATMLREPIWLALVKRLAGLVRRKPPAKTVIKPALERNHGVVSTALQIIDQHKS